MDKIRNIDELIKLLYNNIGLLSQLYEHRNTFLYKDALDSVDGNSKKLENLFQYGIIEQSDDEHIEISSIHRRYFEEVTQSNVEISGGKMDDFINKTKNLIEVIVKIRDNNGNNESLYISKLRSTFGDIAYSARLSGDSLSFKVEETYTTEKNFEVKMVLLRQLRESLEDIYNSIYRLYAFLDKEDYILHQKINNPRVNLSIEKMKLSLSEVDRELIFLRAKLLRYIGSAFFVNDFTHFSIPNDVIVIGVENPENFFRIREQRYLFDRHFPTKKILFVCRYPQESKTDMLSWLTGISNKYVHFGDFDFYGIKIFLQEYKKTLLDRASFFIPYDIENRIRKGNSKLYQEQYLCNTSLVCNDDRLTSLLGLFDKYAKVYEQEGYIIK